MAKYIARHEIPRRVRTDPGTVFKSEKFKQCCEETNISHKLCPISEHMGNGKLERMIRIRNEGLCRNKEIVISKRNTGLSEFCLPYDLKKQRMGNLP